MSVRHPERIVFLLTAVFMACAVTLQVLGFALDSPQMLTWGRWAVVGMVATWSLPLLAFLVSLAIEKFRGDRHD
ncbi:MAG: hypothetical protein AAF790_15145 [Planctomycetota bacterium]